MRLAILPFLLLLVLNISTIVAQNFNFQEVPNPAGHNFDRFLFQHNELAYFTYRNADFNQVLFSYDGTNLENIALPSGYSLEDYFFQDGDRFFFSVIDENFTASLATWENQTFQIFPIDGGFNNLQQFAFEHADLYYFFYTDDNFNGGIQAFDGTSFTEVVFPNGLDWNNYEGEINGVAYVSLFDFNTFAFTFFAFENGTFSPVATPAGIEFGNTILAQEDRLFITFFAGYYFDEQIFTFDGTDFEMLETPAGFPLYDGASIEWQDEVYFSFGDSYFENATLFRYEDDNSWTAFDNPMGLNMGFFPEGAIRENFVYPGYNNQNFDAQMTIFDGNTLNVVPSPNDRSYLGIATEAFDGLLLEYLDLNTFSIRLLYYDNNSLMEVPMQPLNAYNDYETTYKSRIFISFRDASFNSTLFFFNLNAAPISADNTVNTTTETPYRFSAADFTFSDEDLNDVLQGVQIVALPTAGIIHLNGAQINAGDLLPVADLNQLYYVPLDNGTGTPYDQFRFAVWDGVNVSNASYTMFINISPAVSTTDLNLAASLSVFPNPASDWVKVDLVDFSDTEDLQLTLFDANGKRLESRGYRGVPEQFFLDQRPAGIYYLLVQNEEASVGQKIYVAH